MSRQLKILARDLEVPVIALSQLNRNAEQRHDKKPSLADLRESGAIEQDSDCVILLHQEDDLLMLDIAKNRQGPPALVKLRWEGEYARAVSLIKSFDFFELTPEGAVMLERLRDLAIKYQTICQQAPNIWDAENTEDSKIAQNGCNGTVSVAKGQQRTPPAR